MVGFLKSLLGTEEPAQTERRLSHPRDLRAGDIIKFRFLDQSEVGGKQFEVFSVNTYIYGQMCYPELVLKDRTGNIIYMMVEEEDGEEYLALSKKVKKAQINDVISPQDMEAVRERGLGTVISVASRPNGLGEWLANIYKETDDRVLGSFVKGDARYISEVELDKRETFSSHILEDESEKFALEIEYYDTGEVELCVTAYHELSDIEEMWPGKGGKL